MQLRRVQSDVNIKASWWDKMALSKSLKRKVDSENRAYKEEWKDNYSVILPSFVKAKGNWLVHLSSLSSHDSSTEPIGIATEWITPRDDSFFLSHIKDSRTARHSWVTVAVMTDLFQNQPLSK